MRPGRRAGRGHPLGHTSSRIAPSPLR
jgi:hypothetical protein